MAALAAKQEKKKKKENKDELVHAYTFEVYFGNETKVGFTKVSNIAQHEEVEWISDGHEGMTPAVRKPKKGRRRRWESIILERGMTTGASDEAIRDFKPGVHLYDVMIMVLFDNKPVRVFHIKEGIVTRCSFSDMDALRSGLIIRTMEIQHMGLVEEVV